MSAPRWMEQAVCASVDGDLWFPEIGGTPHPAISICDTCPVVVECAEYADSIGTRYGVWGGTSRTRFARNPREEAA